LRRNFDDVAKSCVLAKNFEVDFWGELTPEFVELVKK
jgi:hypothetical protein